MNSQLKNELKKTRKSIEEIDEDSNSSKLSKQSIDDSIHSNLLALEYSTDGIGILDSSKSYIYVNNSYVNIYGYHNQNDILGKSCQLLYNNIEYERLTDYIIPELELHGFWQGESIGLKKDGNTFPQEISLTKTKDEKIICIVRDISEKKLINKILEESEERYRLLFENSPTPIIIINPENGKIIDYNRKAYNSLGYSNNQFCKLNLFDIQICESKEFIINQLKQIMRSEFEQFETNFQTKKADLRNIIINAQPITIKDKNYVQYLCTDITEQKQKNYKLIESETKYRALVEKSHDAIIIFNNKKFVYFNDVTCELTGYTKQELYEINPLSIFSNPDRIKIEEFLKDTLSFNKATPFLETIIITKNKIELNVELGIKIIPHEGTLAALFTIRNITKRRQLEQAYKLLVDNSLQGLAIYQDGVAVFANKKLTEICGYSLDELLSFNHDDVFNIVFQEDRELSRKYMRARAISDEPPIIYKHRIHRKDSQTRWVEVIASKISYNNKPAIQAAYMDVTDQMLAEEALLASEEKYKILVENAFDAIYLMTNDNFEYVNPKFCEITGYSFKELTDKNFSVFTLLDRESVKVYNKRLKARLMGYDIPNQYQMQIISKSGQKVQVELSTAQFGQKDKVHILGIMRDISDRKQVEEEMKDLIIALHISKDLTEERAREIESLNRQLKESENHLKELNINKDKFFSIIAHDLKGPFSGFLGLSKILTTDISELSLDEVQDIAKDLHESAEHLFRLLENLLQWSRIQRKIIQYTPEDINVSDLTNLNIALLSANAKQKGINLINEVNPEVYVFADPNMLNTVLRNLISNAVKFTKLDDKIIISSEYTNDLMIQINVTDTGIGMNEDIMNKLFRIDSHHTTIGTADEKGTGLGLILCKELVEINTGRIWVTSKVGEGTTFSFTLPQSKEEYM